jgi:hypothetical protein
MFVSEFMRGGTRSAEKWVVFEVGTTGQERIKKESDATNRLVKEICDRFEVAKAEMGLPEVGQFSLITRGSKVHNIIFRGSSFQELRDKFPMVDGRGREEGTIRFRDKSAAQKQFAEIMKGCSGLPDQRATLQNALLPERGDWDIDATLGHPGLFNLDDGRAVLTIREGWTTWVKAIEAQGGQYITKAEWLRLSALHEEELEASRAKKRAAKVG